MFCVGSEVIKNREDAQMTTSRNIPPLKKSLPILICKAKCSLLKATAAEKAGRQNTLIQVVKYVWVTQQRLGCF